MVDLAEEHRVRAADDRLGHAALDVRQRSGEQGDVALAADYLGVLELRGAGLRGELVGEVALVGAEDIDREAPGLADGGLRGARHVQPHEHHGRVE